MKMKELQEILDGLMPHQRREFQDYRMMWVVSTRLFRQSYDLGMLTAPIAAQDRDALMSIMEICKRKMVCLLGMPNVLVYREGGCEADTMANLMGLIECWTPDTGAARIYPPQANHSGSGDGRRFRSSQ